MARDPRKALEHLDRVRRVGPKAELSIVNVAYAREVAARIAIATHRDGQVTVSSARAGLGAVRAVALDEPMLVMRECDLALAPAAATWQRADEACHRALAKAPNAPLIATKLPATAHTAADDREDSRRAPLQAA